MKTILFVGVLSQVEVSKFMGEFQLHEVQLAELMLQLSQAALQVISFWSASNPAFPGTVVEQ